MTATSKYLILLFLLTPVLANAQGVSIDTQTIPADYKPALSRVRNHDLIDKEQKAILATDGKTDKQFTPSNNEDINFLVTQALVKKVDNIQYLIETDSVFDHRLKVNYLVGLESVLKYFKQNWKPRSDKKINPANLPQIIHAYEQCVLKDRKGESIQWIVTAVCYVAGRKIVSATFFGLSAGYYGG